MEEVFSNQPDRQSNENRNLPRIGITIGDPAGIGSEIVLKSLAENEVGNFCLPIVIADANYLLQAAQQLNLPCEFKIVENASEIQTDEKQPVILHLNNIKQKINFGEETALGGRASAQYIETAVKLWQEGLIDAIATAPISKKAIREGGYDYPGHTEFLAYLTGTKDFAMSFIAGKLCVVLLSTHVSLKDAFQFVKRERYVGLIRLINRQLKIWGIANPRLAIAGVNPHAGESGLFGDEEIKEINPAIADCRAEGIDVRGAFSADTVFLRNVKGEFDAVIANYHDQATIAVKCLSFGEGVNVTMGLPLIRTSVDHGTAFDIAGQNIAQHSSMKAAILLAADLYQRKLK